MNGDFCIMTRCSPGSEPGEVVVHTTIHRRQNGEIKELNQYLPEFVSSEIAPAVFERQHKTFVQAILEF